MATGHSRLQSLTGTRPILKDRFSKARESLLKGVRFVRALCWKSISLIRAFMSWFNANWKGKGDRRYIVTLPSPPLPRLILQPRPINGTIQPIKEIVIAFERESFVSLELEKKKRFLWFPLINTSLHDFLK